VLELEQLKLEIDDFKQNLDEMGNLFDIASIGNQIEELEQKASEPDFWNDTENSQKILQKIKSLRSKVERYNKLVFPVGRFDHFV